MLAQAGKLLPALPAVHGLEDGGVFDACIHGIRIGQRRLEMPDALELPRVRRAVIPLMGARHAGVLELIADRLPVLSSVIGSLHHLAVPAGALRRIEAI